MTKLRYYSIIKNISRIIKHTQKVFATFGRSVTVQFYFNIAQICVKCDGHLTLNFKQTFICMLYLCNRCWWFEKKINQRIKSELIKIPNLKIK